MKSSEALALNIKPEAVVAIGITNQRETTVVWDRETGEPLYNAIVWNDMRTEDTVDSLKASRNVSEKRIRKLTGLPISTYFSGVKLAWLRANVPRVDEALEAGTAIFGTIDTWLVWNLARERSHVTDVTNAGRTMLMNLYTRQWDDELLRMLNVPRSALPEIRSCSDVFGHLTGTLLEGTPITGLVGDQQAALIGQAGFEVGHGKNTYGTGCFLIVNTGTTPKFSTHGLLTTPAYQLGEDAPIVYSLEGSVAVAGAAVTWLKNKIGVIRKASEIEDLARQVEDTGDVYFVPAFAGLFAPRWESHARGCFVGITQFTNKSHIARATLESIAFQVADVLRAVEKDMGAPLGELRVDGGASVNNLLLEMQADLLGSEVVRPRDVETTALGAALAAGLKVGFFESTDRIGNMWEEDKRFSPQIDDDARDEKLHKWEAAVQRSLDWTKPRPAFWGSMFGVLKAVEQKAEKLKLRTVVSHVTVAVAACAFASFMVSRLTKN